LQENESDGAENSTKENIKTRKEDTTPDMVQTIHGTDESIKEVTDETTEEETRMMIAGEESNVAECSTTENIETKGEDTTPAMVQTIHETHKEEEVAEKLAGIDEDNRTIGMRVKE
jgi:hypothetical protein